MAPRNSRSVNRCGHAHLACQFPINVTVPSGVPPRLLFATHSGIPENSCTHYRHTLWSFLKILAPTIARAEGPTGKLGG